MKKIYYCAFIIALSGSHISAALSELPAFLVKDGGLNSGFMIAHCTAASLGEAVLAKIKCF